MSGTTQRTMQEPEITWTLQLSQARYILSLISKQPFEQVNGLFQMLEQQGNQQLQQFEAQMKGNGQDASRLPS